MAKPLTQDLSASSDYFDNDPDFLRALGEFDIPEGSPPHEGTRSGSIPRDPGSSQEVQPPPCAQPRPKRPRSPDSGDEESEGLARHRGISSIDGDPKQAGYLASDVYGAAHFGDFGEYMSRKRAKLQIQNAEMDEDEMDGEEIVPKSRIFEGLQIYINGWTEPSVQDLRKLILQHGGIFHAYLDKKSLVTHIITCSLTPAKLREFKYMKVVRPEWLVQSAKTGVLLPWHDFIFNVNERLEDTQGKRAGQTSLLQNFVTQSSRGPQRSSAGTDSPQGPSSGVLVSNSEPSPPAVGPSTPPTTPQKTPAAPKTPKKAVWSTDPATPEQVKLVPGYAAAGPNKAAERAMEDPAWRAAHTSVAPDFIEGYYRNSRLHHLSTWKAELRELVGRAQELAENRDGENTGDGDEEGAYVDGAHDGTVGKIVRENIRGKGWADGRDADGEGVSMRGAQLRKGKGKGKAADDEEKVIMHCDFDSFFVSAGLVDRPHLRGKPVVVCHSQGAQGGKSSTSEIASASYEARAFGIKSGMSLQQARNLCPGVLTIPYEFQRYKEYSLKFYTILMSHADDLQAVSVDEALIEVTSSVRRINTEIARSQDSPGAPMDPAKEFAEAIRAQVKKATGCEVSIGISHNIMLARLASRKAKPAGSFHLRQEDLPTFITDLEIDDLHGFGRSAYEKAQEKLGTTTLVDFMKMSKAMLCDALGKGMGEVLYNALRGVDTRKLESDKPRKSVSCDINYGIRFETNEQVETFMYQVAEEIVRRLNDIDMRGRSLTLKIMKRSPSAPVEAPKFMGHGMCDTYTKSAQLGQATNNPKVIGEHAWRLLKLLNFDPKELRGIGMQIQRLESASAGPEMEAGQAVLPFTRTTVPTKSARTEQAEPVAGPSVRLEPPPQPQHDDPPRPANNFVDLPSFSQVDMSVFDALPDELRQELEQEYQRRSVTPALPETRRSRSVSVFPVTTPKGKGKEKALFPGPAPGKKDPNVKRITRQLAPRSRSSIPAAQTKLFAKQRLKAKPSSSPAVNVTNEELERLDIDPDVFFMLPREVQREQLAFMRQKAKGSGLAFCSQRKAIKATKLKGNPIPKKPPPKARYLDPPTLKQRGPDGEKLAFTEKDDVQCVIEKWVDGFMEHPPNQQDVDFFAKFLVRCVDSSWSSDSGVEKAIAVAKWWLILLRRRFAAWEGETEEMVPRESREIQRPYTSEMVARAWWRAFREVKAKMDDVARRKFGGRLSLR